MVTVPAGVSHKFENGGDETAHVRVQVRPALKMEQLFETAVALANEGRTTSKGMPKPLDLALFVREFARRGPGRLPARVGPAGHHGAARLGRAQARPRRALRPGQPGLRRLISRVRARQDALAGRPSTSR